jgi:protein-L-isoaspartate(D-aspartate) O-methyltransferase
VPLRRDDEPAEWLARAYGPRYVITQVDDGAPAGPDGRGQVPTSSASRPDIVAAMLAAGNLERGMRVLEVGTGTGYTAALLAHYLGARNVTSIEVDPDLAARARTALERAGYGEITVITGNGARGDPGRAPFDRVLSTVAAPRVPYAWVAQTQPGGLVVTPWGSAYKPAGLLSLTVQPDGTATGSPVNTTISFMPLRDQRTTRAAVADLVRDTDTPTSVTPACMPPTSATMTRPLRSPLRFPGATLSTRPPPVMTVGACGFSTRAPGPGRALTTSRAFGAGRCTSPGRADSGMRSPPPTTGGTTSAGPRPPIGVSPSRRTSSGWSWPTSRSGRDKARSGYPSAEQSEGGYC